MKDKVWDFIVTPKGFATRKSVELANVTLWASSLLGRLGGPGSFMDAVLNAQIAGNALASNGAYIQGDLFAMMANDTVALYLATRNILTRISMQSCSEGMEDLRDILEGDLLTISGVQESLPRQLRFIDLMESYKDKPDFFHIRFSGMELLDEYYSLDSISRDVKAFVKSVDRHYRKAERCS
ncbi:hypothetical protein EGX65_03630 [Escherichia coli]|uniref:Uncharacterized protein n=2 Tax=Escherichia coli TaxID=562 RepID=A0A168T6Y0_ECOLX|nr:hypothetical protein [Escherichia coli]EEW5971672.1 hypothetical protein [Escherichia coli]EFA9199961.1 hypothetical protein [Escherichia coli]EFB9698144.1 hypothetical protein [Escherichia coli]EFB9702387.1 hypothetical protein [Escherichia coli]EFC2247457.1 hypothetical protein [Escherichia coli]